MRHLSLWGLGALAFAVACSDKTPTGSQIAVPSAISAAVNGQSGTTLSAYKTATGFVQSGYTWTLKKEFVSSMDVGMVDLGGATPVLIPQGQTRWLEYRIVATRTGSNTTFSGVSGQICVTNGGDVATVGLAISDVIQYKTGGGPFQNLGAAHPVDVSAQTSLAPGASHCYPYSFTFTPVAGAQYRNTAFVTITNHSGHLGEAFGPAFNGGGVKADFTLPSTASGSTLDASATLSDNFVAQCTASLGAAFECGTATLGTSWHLVSGSKPDDHNGWTDVITGNVETWTLVYLLDVTNHSGCQGTLLNTATLTTDGTNTVLPASTSTGITANCH
ncbi:MAG: hypothetical protein M3081_22045 [Gemmatimonadota bacterium]|nr:hypothetical protein [Gemmatimonadota bacterium]